MAKSLQPSVLGKVRVSDLTPNEFNELKQLASQFGDFTLLGDKSTLAAIYELSKMAKKSASVSRKRVAQKLENFVLSAAASRKLYYREYQQTEERKQTLGARLSKPDEPLLRKRKRQSGERTDIFE